MKGPHFFEKRKKEMARQEKAKQKAERKAQRKAGKGKDDGEPGDDDDDLLLAEGAETQIEGQLPGSEEAPEEVSQEASKAGIAPSKDRQPEHSSAPGRPGDPI
jgi:hypothetical protein